MAGNWRRSPKAAISFESVKGKKLWTAITHGIAFYSVNPPQGEEPGSDVIIYFPYPNGHYLFNLSNLTLEEYNNVRKIIATALTAALPIIKERDANAAKLIESGEVGPTRAYREIPRLFGPDGPIQQ